jgi:HK97 gp10 family phage protein
VSKDPALHLVRVRLHQHEIDQLDESTDAAELTLAAAWGVALDARDGAPRRTGDGAASIQPWPGRDQRGPSADVGWDQDHFYMRFHEDGTHTLAARPFLRPALDRYTHL